MMKSNMFAESVLVTGSNRGIGLEFTRQLAGATKHLFAACRFPSEADELKKIADIRSNVVIIALDLTDSDSISKAVEKVAEVTGERGLNCPINNAGVLNMNSLIEKCTAHSLRSTHEVNVIGPAMVIKAFLPLLRNASSTCSGNYMSVSRAAITNISSNVASLENNTLENELILQKYGVSCLCYEYRMSKVALNMLTRSLSIELKSDSILAVIVHPGWVKTRMGGDTAQLTPFESVESMLKMMPGFDETNNGLFYQFDGEALPW